MFKRHALITLIGALGLSASACDDEQVVQVSSLEGPRAAISVRGEVCIDTFVTEGLVTGETFLCDEGERGNLGLVVSSNNDRLGLVDLYPADFDPGAEATELRPRFLDTDPGTPGVTHLEVGRLPVDVAVSPNGRVAYTLDQLDRTVSVVDLLGPEHLEQRYHLPATPIAFAVSSGGEILTLSGVPSTLTIHPGTTCDTNVCTVPDDEPIEIPLASTATDIEVQRDDTFAYVTYRDRDVVSVIALEGAELGDDFACQDRTAPPCTVTEIPLTFGCRDGIDNDGDGLTDRDDPQCLSPLGAESPVGGGPSRTAVTPCNDGVDNDEDGLIDLLDPECLASGGLSETYDMDLEPVLTACNDGIDNDGDGQVDLGDEGCYSAAGRTEKSPPSLGFDAVSIDPDLTFGWVLDTANSQILVFDAVRKRLIDVPKSASPPYDDFVGRLGIAVPASPISIEARTSSDLVTNETADGNIAGYLRTAYSVLVGVDNGFAYNVVAINSFCDDLSGETCGAIPEFPQMAPPMDATPECELPACTCEGEGCPCAEDPDFIGRRIVCNGETRIFANPVFDINQAADTQARVVGLGQCTIPGDLVESLNQFARQNPGAPLNPASCDSELVAQPRPLGAPTIEEETTPADIDLESLGRAEVIERADAAWSLTEAGAPAYQTSPWSARVTTQRWTVVYEGVLPRTRRTDWILPTSTSTTTIDGEEVETITLQSSADLCASGARPGDLFVLTTDPLERQGCAAFTDTDDEFRTYEIVRRDQNSLTLRAIDGFAPLATRSAPGESGCWESGVSAEIRASDTWVVSGDRTGHLASQMSRNGVCIPSRIPEAADGRVATGGDYIGPSLRFTIYPGFVDPVRDLEFVFDTESGFASDRFRVGPERNETVGILPFHIDYRDFLDDDIVVLMATDPDANFVFVRTVIPTIDENGNEVQAVVTDLVN